MSNLISKFSNKKSLILLSILAIIFLIKIFLLTKLDGLGWEPDEYMHFLEAKTLFTNFPNNLDIGIGVWSKPGYIYLHGLIILIFGITTLFQAQIIGIVITLLTSFIVLKILEEFKCSFKIQVLGLILTNFSSLMLRGSLSIMTEPIFALFLVTGIYFLIRKKFILASLMIGLLPLVRIEGLFFLIILILTYLFHKKKSKILNIFLVILPTLIWNSVGFLITGRLFYIIDSGYPLTAGKYGHGGYPFYMEGFFKLDPIVFILFVTSSVFIYRYFKNKEWVKFGIIFSFLLFFFLQTIFWKFGLFGTAGLMRYFITVIPLAVISICLFFNEIDFKTKVESKAIVLIVCMLQIIFSILLFTRGGVEFNQQTKASAEVGISEAGNWIKQFVKPETKLYSDLPEIIYFADRDLNNSTIFGIDEAYQNNETAVYAFKKSSIRDEEFLKNLKGSEIINFNDNVYILIK